MVCSSDKRWGEDIELLEREGYPYSLKLYSMCQVTLENHKNKNNAQCTTNKSLCITSKK